MQCTSFDRPESLRFPRGVLRKSWFFREWAEGCSAEPACDDDDALTMNYHTIFPIKSAKVTANWGGQGCSPIYYQ